MANSNFANDRADEPLDVNTAVKDSGTWAKSVSVTVAVEQVNKEFDAVTGELASAVNLPGFRAGKVPRNIVEKRFGDDIRKQVTSNLLQRAVRTAILKEKLQVIGEPVVEVEKIKVTKNEPLAFDLEVEVKPSFELGNYKGLTVEQEEIEVLQEELDQALIRVRERFAEQVDAGPEHAIVERDSAGGPLRFLVDGNEVHKEDGMLLVMDGHVMGAYAHLGSKFLLGAKIGEKRTVEETLAGNFPVAEHREKKATIEFEVKSIRSQKLPEANDELAVKMGMKTATDLTERIRTSLLENIGNEIKERTRSQLLEQVVSATPFELPSRLTEMAGSRNLTSKMQYFERMGLPREMVLERQDEIIKSAREQAAAEMRRFFVLDAICTKEGIVIGEDEIDEEIVKRARSQGKRASELYDQMVESGELQQIEGDLKIQKALEALVEHAEVKIVPRKPLPKEQEEGGLEHPEHAPQHGHEHSHDHGHEGHSHGEHGQ